jgi:hypothetical protein
LPSPRPQLSDQLQEASRRRDPAATARLTGQWVHRHGLDSLHRFCRDALVDRQGAEAGDWLQGQLEAAGPPSDPSPLAPADSRSPLPPVDSGSPLAAADSSLEEAFAAQEASIFIPAPGSPPPGVAEVVAEPAPATDSQPAPAPSVLADLPTWLSGAPQHRRAS